jgi:hypothetical protein
MGSGAIVDQRLVLVAMMGQIGETATLARRAGSTRPSRVA